MTLDLYTLHGTPTDGEFVIQKFDKDYVWQSLYALSATICTCPQGHKPKCRHRTMLPMFLQHGHIGDGWFLEWNTRMWRRPLMEIPAIVEGARQMMRGELANDIIAVTGKGAWDDKTVKATIEQAQLASACAGENEPSLPAPGAVPPPPSPPEGPQPARAAEAAPVSPG